MIETASLEPTLAAIQALYDRLIELHKHVCKQAECRLARYEGYYPEGLPDPGALNLAHYLALRSFDLREMQDELSALGLSSLGRGEASVLENLNRIIRLLGYIVCTHQPGVTIPLDAGHFPSGTQRLKNNTDSLLGQTPFGRKVRIMVTLPGDAANDYPLVKKLIEKGMNCARINCAHDDRVTWELMISNISRAEAETGRSCRIMMDLGGQKIRTGRIIDAPAVLHLKVKRDDFGKITEPALIHLVPDFCGDSAEKFQIVIPANLHSALQIGDRLYFVDTRNKQRQFEIIDQNSSGVLLARCWKNVYLSDKTVFQWYRKEAPELLQQPVFIPVSGLPSQRVKIRLFRNDLLQLTSPDIAGQPAIQASGETDYQPAQIGMSHPGLFTKILPGASVWIDDGKIGATVEEINALGILLRITHAHDKGFLLKPDKGINFPDTELDIPALTDKDIEDLDFISEYADMVAFSFVQTSEDMLRLINELKQRNTHDIPIIAKIETAKAVRNLPDIILSCLGLTGLGVMIARGDLAVELGSVRMAEMQEELLWLCEAAHVPVIWATQVLESFAKQGIQSRPEITDAAMSVRAECVMLNKGPYILEAVAVLDDILARMQQHQNKKFSLLRALKQWPMPPEIRDVGQDSIEPLLIND